MMKKWIIIISTALVALAAGVVVLLTAPDTHSISVNPQMVYLEPDMIKLIEVKISPENVNPKNIRYISTDKSVALAENGQIKGISPGYAEVHIEDIKSGVKSEIIKVTVLESIAAKLSAQEDNTPEKDNTSEKDTKPEDVQTDAPQKDGVVYTGKSGTKYHRYDCSTLKATKNEMSLEDAAKSGKTPCKICNP